MDGILHKLHSDFSGYENNIILAVKHKTEKVIHLFVITSHVNGVVYVYNNISNQIPNWLDDYTSFVAYHHPNKTITKQQYNIMVRSYQKDGYDVKWDKKRALRIRCSINLETVAALRSEGENTEERGYAVVRCSINNIVVGVFDSYKHAERFIDKCYGADQCEGVVYADNELTAKYKASLDEDEEMYSL